MADKTVFIGGITGCQGGAVAYHALKRGWTVHGLARNPIAPNAIALRNQGVRLFTGDYDNIPVLEKAIANCTAIFIVPTPVLNDPNIEHHRVKSILTIAQAAGVQTVVVSTGLGTDEPEKLTGWEGGSLFARLILSKQRIEETVQHSEFRNWILLRPALFMANFIEPKVAMYPGLRETGRWTTGLLPTSRLPMIDDLDIGAFAVSAFENPEKFRGKKIELGIDFLTASEVMAALSNATGRDMTAVYMSEEEIHDQKRTNPLLAGSLALRDVAGLVDIDKVKSFGIPMTSFDDYLKRENQTVRKTYN